jgi:hypothetical protein
MRKLLFLLALLPLIGSYVQAQTTTPVAAGQCMQTNGTGGWALTACSSGGTSAVNYTVESYGAVGDATGAAGVGTDNTTAIQACINALEALTIPQGNCNLANKKYRITAPIIINKSSINIIGSSPGAWTRTTSNQLLQTLPISALVIDSATATAVELNPASAGGGLSNPVSFNQFRSFSIIRTLADTGVSTGSCKGGTGIGVGAAGLSIEYAGGWVVDDVWSFDSACDFYFNNAGAYGTGRMENSGGMWGSNGFNPTVPVYGILVNGTYSAESFRLRHSFIQTLYPGYSGVQSVGLLVTGSQLNDFMIDNFETAFVTYGEYFQYLGGGGSYSCSDIHLLDTINDSFFQAGIVLSGMTQACGSSVEINGGWSGTSAAGSASNSAGVNVTGSSGVTISNMEFGQNGSQAYGVLANSTSSHIAIVGNHFLNQVTAAIALNTVRNATITGNIIEAPSGNNSVGIQGVSLVRSTISANSISGYMNYGVTLDSGCSYVTTSNVYAIDAANFTHTTPVTDSGTNDVQTN